MKVRSAQETYGPTVSVAIVGMFGTPSNDPRSAGFRGFASCSLKAVMRAFVLIDMAEKVLITMELMLPSIVLILHRCRVPSNVFNPRIRGRGLSTCTEAPFES
jgi:hypothetical protein